MYKITKLLVLVYCFSLLLTTTAYSQIFKLTFNVDMTDAVANGVTFDTGKHEVHLEWSAFNQFQTIRLAPVDEDGLIYARSITTDNPEITYRYYIRDNATRLILGEEKHYRILSTDLYYAETIINDVYDQYPGGPSVTISNPTEGQTFRVGVDTEIPVRINLSGVANATWSMKLIGETEVLILNRTVVDGEGDYDYTIPLPDAFPGGIYRIQLEYFLWKVYSSGTILSNPFEIINNSPSLQILSPVAEDSWIEDESCKYIVWNSANLKRVNILYSIDTGNTWNMIEENIESNNGYDVSGINDYRWIIPAGSFEGLHTGSLIKIEDAVHPEYFSISQPFTLGSSPLKFIAPTENLTYHVGTDEHIPIEIRSIINSPGPYELWIEHDNSMKFVGGYFEVQGTGTYDHQYVLPFTLPSGEYSFVLKYYFPEMWLSATHHSPPFTIVNNQPSIDIVYPSVDNVWLVGNRYNITWNSGNVAKVNLHYTPDLGETWELIQENVDSRDGYEFHGTNRYVWEVPNDFSLQNPESQIRIEDASGSEVFHISDPFMIRTSPVTFLSPTPQTVHPLCHMLDIVLRVGEKSDLGLYLVTEDTGMIHPIGFFPDVEAGEFRASFDTDFQEEWQFKLINYRFYVMHVKSDTRHHSEIFTIDGVRVDDDPPSGKIQVQKFQPDADPLLIPTSAQPFTISFNLEMRGAILKEDVTFDPDKHEVYISGPLTGPATPGSDQSFRMLRQGPEGIYTISLSTYDQQIAYNYTVVDPAKAMIYLTDWNEFPDRVRIHSIDSDTVLHDIFGSPWGLPPFSFLTPVEGNTYTTGADNEIRYQISFTQDQNYLYSVYLVGENVTDFNISGMHSVSRKGTYNHAFTLSDDIPEGTYRLELHSYMYIDDIRFEMGRVYSNSFEIINHSSSVQILTPGENAFFTGGRYVNIHWRSINVDQVDIMYSLDIGATWDLIVENLKSKDGLYPLYSMHHLHYLHSLQSKLNIYQWLIPAAMEGMYDRSLIKIQASDNPELFSISQPFTIVTAPLKFIKPEANMVYTKGDIITFEIESYSNWPANYSIMLNSNLPDRWEHIPGTYKTTGKGVYKHEYAIPSTLPVGEYNFILVSGGQVHYLGIHSLPFTIESNETRIVLIDPKEGDYRIGENTYDIRWTSSMISKVNLYYSLDGGKTRILIAENVDNKTGYNAYNRYSWSIPKIAGTFDKCQIRIEDASNPEIFDVSKLFTIRKNPVTFLQPTAQTNHVAGQELLIRLLVEEKSDIALYLGGKEGLHEIAFFTEVEGMFEYNWESPMLIPGPYFIYAWHAESKSRSQSDEFNVALSQKYKATFCLDMSHVIEYDPAVHKVFLTGDFTHWAVPGTEGSIVMDVFDESNRICKTVQTLDAGRYYYKYFTDAIGPGWNGGEWKGQTARHINLKSNIWKRDIWGLHPDVYFSLELRTEPLQAGIVSGSGQYHTRDQVDIVAEENKGFVFVSWRDADGNNIWTEKELIFGMPAKHIVLTAFYEAVTGVDEWELPLCVFPNPAEHQITIISDELMNELWITDLSGKTIIRFPLQDKEISVDLSGRERGIYLLHIKTDNNSAVRKIVLR
jgi:hypothetical protein